MKLSAHAKGELAIGESTKIDNWCRARQGPDDKRGAASRCHKEESERDSGCPAVPRCFLQSDLERGQRCGDKDQGGEVQLANLAEPRFRARQDKIARHNRQNAWPHIDQKKPGPTVGRGDPSAGNRSYGWGQNGKHPGNGGGERLTAAWKEHEARGEDDGYQRAAGKSLDDARAHEGREARAPGAAQPTQ